MQMKRGNNKIKTDDKEYWIPTTAFSEVYKGHGGTRFVTKEAYLKWKEEMMNQIFKKK
jgi:hypothetical protein